MQDNAAIHTAKATKSHMKGRQMDFIADWPPHSPDLNPIENVWGIMKQKIDRYNKHDLDKREGLIASVKAAWNAIPLSTIDRLIESFHPRLDSVLQSKGGRVQ